MNTTTDTTMTTDDKIASILGIEPSQRDLRVMAKTALLCGDYEFAAALRSLHDKRRKKDIAE